MSGKRVIITAAADGIGKVVAEAYLAQGAKVALCDVQADKVAAMQKAHPEVLAEVCDVSDEAALRAWMQRALDGLGGCDTLINNAGIAGPTALIEEIPTEQVRACLNIGLISHFICTAMALPTMKAQKSGLIVNLSSAAGLFAFPLRTPYSATKWAVIGVTKSLAAEVGADGIRVNAICPGAIAGDRIDRVIAAKAKAEGRPLEEVRDETAARASLRCFIPPEDIAGMILHLESPTGCRISGQALAVDGHLMSLA